jgi:5-phospho-D-xylono-1,4-lactonase
MTFIRTVLGDIPAEQLGVCYAHEHLIIDPSFTTTGNPDFLLNDEDACVAELTLFFNAGGRAVVDSMPCDCGRNVVKLASASRRSGIHVVAPTGLHLSKYYDPGHWGNQYSEAQLTALFAADIETGIDRHDYNGPCVERTSHRAGVIKVATGASFTPREEKIFAAAAAVHCSHGCPILTHTEQGELALEQIRALQSHGVNLAHVCLSHTDRKPDVGYHREILSTGVRVEFDSAFRWPGEDNPTLRLILTLLPEYPSQIMLGMDAARRKYWTSYGGGPGLAYLLGDFSSRLLAHGLGSHDLKSIFVDTPAATYSFAETRAKCAAVSSEAQPPAA